MKKTIILYILTCFSIIAIAQGGMKELSHDPKKLKLLIGTEVIGYTGSMIGLYQLWYADYPMSKFHFFNDNDGWKAIDKYGHALSAYTVGRLGMEALSWTGVSRKNAVWYGGTLGLFFLTSVEILDGFSDGWGASPGDILANTFGAGLLIGQEYLWQEQRISVKFSYSHSPYQQHNPKVLGHNLQERILKDYNGQTHWYSVNIASFLKEESKVPDWLNFAFGYGAGGMLHGYQNPEYIDGVKVEYFKPYRQYYISPDIDLTKIKTNSKFLNTVLFACSFIKFPMPALEYHEFDKLRFHWLFF